MDITNNVDREWLDLQAVQTEAFRLMRVGQSNGQLFPRFTSTDLDCLKAAPVAFTKDISYVYCAVECGYESDRASTSTWCAVTIASDEPTTIVNVDVLDVKDFAEAKEMISLHLQHVRSIPQCANATIVLDVESVTGLETGAIIDYVSSNFVNVTVLKSFARKPGTVTNNTTQVEMVRHAEQLFRSPKKVRIHESFTKSAYIDTLIHQLERYIIHTEPTGDGSMTTPRVVLKRSEKTNTNEIAHQFLRAVRARFHRVTINIVNRVFAENV